MRLIPFVSAAAALLTVCVSAAASDAHELERLSAPIPVEATSPADSPVAAESGAFGIAEDRRDADAPMLEITVLAASSLAPELTALLAEEVLRLRPLPVSIVYRGLPVAAGNGPASYRHDKAESERRLAPLLSRGLGAVIDPGVFRRTEKALGRLGEAPDSLPLPAVLLTTKRGTEIVTGTVSVAWAVGYALSRTTDPVWRSEAVGALRKAGVLSLVGAP